MSAADVPDARPANVLHELLQADSVHTDDSGELVATTFDPDRAAAWQHAADVLARHGSLTNGTEATYAIAPAAVAQLADAIGLPDGTGPGFPDASDRELLDAARRQLEQERDERQLLDAVDELRNAADGYVSAALRGEATTDAWFGVVEAAHRLLRGAA